MTETERSSCKLAIKIASVAWWMVGVAMGLLLAVFMVGSAHGQTITAGYGITVNGQTIAVEDALIPMYMLGTGPPPPTCAPVPLTWFVDTANKEIYFCVAKDLWVKLQTVVVGPPPVQSVAGKTGAITLAIGDIAGLQAALDAKQNAGTNTVVVTPSFAPIAINCGGPAYTDASGLVWAADSDFTGGSVSDSGAAIVNTTTPALYQTAHWGNFGYQFAVPNGQYTVTLKFAELYWTAPGNRVFHVAINGNQVLTGFDIFSAAGGANTAIDKSFPVTVTGGKIVLDFINVADYPWINAIKITSP